MGLVSDIFSSYEAYLPMLTASFRRSEFRTPGLEGVSSFDDITLQT